MALEPTSFTRLRPSGMPQSQASDDPKLGIDSIDAIEAHGDARDANNKVHARVLRKVDWYVLPLVTLLYLLCVLNRNNIGEYCNAKIAGMSTDLDLVGLRYNIVTAIFFVRIYMSDVRPGVTKTRLGSVHPRTSPIECRPKALSTVSMEYIPVLMIACGLVTTLTCLVKTYPELLVARVFFGLAESGLFPGVTYYISLWYPRDELAKRIAIFSSAATLAGAFGGFLAMGGLHGWQWIFCLEGIAEVLVALAASFLMHDFPETASFLTETERRYWVEVMKADSQGLATHYDSRFVLQALKDYKIYVQFGISIGFSVPAYAIAFFTPTIINELGYSAANSQLLSIPPYAASCIYVILVGIYSDRHHLRGPYVIAAALIGVVGIITLYTQTRPGAALVGLVLAIVGITPSAPVILVWVSSNAGGDFKRGVAIAMVTGLADIGGICSCFMFFDPPRFHVGLEITMALMSSSILLTLFAMWNYDRLNKQKEKLCAEHGITDDQKGEFREDGDDSPLFRYTL
ncbi:major facilitator superfamily domain-containing protein [Boletus coccyginus]|nr:major facilitator superfamily domain-containing protein [Boletus coccyginus]